MDSSFNEDQKQIANQARRFLEKECSMNYVHAMAEDPQGFTKEIWAKMAELGWMGMRIPEAYGGMGMGLVDLTIVLEEMGRAVFPGPFFSTVLLAAEALIELGNDAQRERYLSGIATGETRGTLALYEPEGGADPAYIQMKAKSNKGEFVLNGTKLFVPDAQASNFLVCAARTAAGNDPEQGITLFLVDSSAKGVSISPLPGMDGTRKLCAVEFKGVRVGKEGILGEPNKGWKPLLKALQRAQVGLCAESIGGAQRSMEMAVEYAKVRVQFDQPIGGFQAIKHRCAQMFLEVESARSLLYWAAWAQDHGDPRDAALAASAAKAYCTEVFKGVATSAIQVLGGTGFSWEHDIHFYLKRAKANEVALGDPVYHREQMARFLETADLSQIL
jgi:alkylation response protein AidB-like acyl-CoA dehydrogenase